LLLFYIKMKYDFFQITFQHDLDFFLWMNRTHENISDSSPFRSPYICKQLVSYKQCGLTVCSHQTHGFPVVFHRRLMGVADIMDTDLFVEHLYPRLLIVREQTAGISHALQLMEQLFG